MRADRGEADAAWPAWRDPHDLRPGRDDLDAGGSPDEVAAALAPYRAAGFEHVIFVFRSPFDLETMDRLPELRAALAADRERCDERVTAGLSSRIVVAVVRRQSSAASSSATAGSTRARTAGVAQDRVGQRDR